MTEKEKMDLTYTMKNSVIPFWELTDWIFYINNNYPYRLEDWVGDLRRWTKPTTPEDYNIQ